MVSLTLSVVALTWWATAGGAQSADTDALARLLNEVPQCAQPCLLEAVGNSPCDLLNATCICTTPSIEGEGSICIVAACSFRESLVAKNATSTFCSQPVRDRSSPYNRMNITLGIVTAMLVLLRLFFRLRFVPTPLGFDDHFVHLAFITAIPSTVMNTQGLTANGLGRDIWTLEWTTVITFAKFFYVMQIMYFTHLPLLKTAMLLFFLRTFPDKKCKKLLRLTVVVNALGGAVFWGVVVLQCWPVKYTWEQWKQPSYEGHCVQINAVGWTHAVFNILLDVWMLILPLTQIRHLRMHWKKKLSVAIMFGVGTFVTVVSMLRLQSLVDYGSSENPTYDQWAVASWSTIEINVGIMCACMPALRGLLVRIFPYVFGSDGSRGTGHNGSFPLNSGDLTADKRTAFSGGGTLEEARGVGRTGPCPDALKVKGVMSPRSFEMDGDTDYEESILVMMRPETPRMKSSAQHRRI